MDLGIKGLTLWMSPSAIPEMQINSVSSGHCISPLFTRVTLVWPLCRDSTWRVEGSTANTFALKFNAFDLLSDETPLELDLDSLNFLLMYLLI